MREVTQAEGVHHSAAGKDVDPGDGLRRGRRVIVLRKRGMKDGLGGGYLASP